MISTTRSSICMQGHLHTACGQRYCFSRAVERWHYGTRIMWLIRHASILPFPEFISGITFFSPYTGPVRYSAMAYIYIAKMDTSTQITHPGHTSSFTALVFHPTPWTNLQPPPHHRPPVTTQTSHSPHQLPSIGLTDWTTLISPPQRHLSP